MVEKARKQTQTKTKKKTSSSKTRTSSAVKPQNNRGNAESVKTSSEPKATSWRWIWVVVAILAAAAIVVGVLLAILNMKPKTYNLTVEGAQDVHCTEQDGRKSCTAWLELPAEVNERGGIPGRSLTVQVEGDGELSSDARKLATYQIAETEYGALENAETIEGTKKLISLQDRDKIRVTYTLTVKYRLSDEDRATLKRLNEEYQRKQAEEQARKEQAEKERAEREAREKLAKTPFTYRSAACGFQKDVYCLLLSDFNAGELWKERVQATFDDFISKTSNVTKSKHLIYIFQNAQCFQEKIDSDGLSVCQIPRGEIAVSMDDQGITWSYENN